jgi:hypothetical protein
MLRCLQQPYRMHGAVHRASALQLGHQQRRQRIRTGLPQHVPSRVGCIRGTGAARQQRSWCCAGRVVHVPWQCWPEELGLQQHLL